MKNFWHIQLHPGEPYWDIHEIDNILLTHSVIGMAKEWEGDGGAPRQFMNDVRIGDIVIIRHGGSPRYLVEVIGDFKFNEGSDQINVWFELYRRVAILSDKGAFFKEKYKKEKGNPWNTGIYAATTFQPANNWDFAKYWYNEIIKQISMDRYVNLLKNNKNLILTGAPGTGKTYLAKQIAEQMGAVDQQCGFVQFHPSYDYTDFVEGLRPIKKGGTIGFERKDGVFKSFCKKALTLSSGSLFDTVYNSLIQSIRSGKLTTVQLKTKPSAKLDVRGTDSIGWYSETEKGNKSSNVVSKDRLKKLYEVYNTLEKLDNMTNINESIQSVIGGCDSTYYWGVLHHILKQPFVFIIDEINRGEISKIFGELFYSIDPGYRGGKGRVDTQYQNLIPKEGDIDFEANNADAFRFGFYVPENVYIIGTMNDIDRSVESMDFAMRRRFAWKEVSAKSSQSILDEEDAWGENGKPEQMIIDTIKVRMDNLNACIIDEYKKEFSTKDEIGLTKAYQIGAAYFLKYSLYENNQFENLWNNHLEGLLREYLRGTTDLEDKIKKLKAAYDDESKNQNEKLVN